MRRVYDCRLESKTARRKLAPTKSYNVGIAPGIRLGYRPSSKTSGSWSVLIADGRGNNSVKRFALADDCEPCDGRNVLSFVQAQRRALAIARGNEAGFLEDQIIAKWDDFIKNKIEPRAYLYRVPPLRSERRLALCWFFAVTTEP